MTPARKRAIWGAVMGTSSLGAVDDCVRALNCPTVNIQIGVLSSMLTSAGAWPTMFVTAFVLDVFGVEPEGARPFCLGILSPSWRRDSNLHGCSADSDQCCSLD